MAIVIDPIEVVSDPPTAGGPVPGDIIERLPDGTWVLVRSLWQVSAWRPGGIGRKLAIAQLGWGAASRQVAAASARLRATAQWVGLHRGLWLLVGPGPEGTWYDVAAGELILSVHAMDGLRPVVSLVMRPGRWVLPDGTELRRERADALWRLVDDWVIRHESWPVSWSPDGLWAEVRDWSGWSLRVPVTMAGPVIGARAAGRPIMLPPYGPFPSGIGPVVPVRVSVGRPPRRPTRKEDD